VLRARLRFRPSASGALLTLLMHAATLSIAVYLLSLPGLASLVFGSLLLPVALFQAFSLLHECGHGSFSTQRTLVTAVGHYASLLCFLPFFPWKYLHAEHHAWTGNADRDPGLALVRRARDTGDLPALVRAAWRTWLPLAGFAQHLVYWSYPWVAFRRGELRGGRLARSVASVAFLACSYTALARLAPAGFAFVRLVPGLVLYLVLVELVNIPHHVGLTSFDERLPVWKQHLPTRSCNYPRGLSEFVVLNFNFHIEHHVFPTLPWYRLRAARALLKPALGESYREAHGVLWHLRARAHPLTEVCTGTALSPR